jgi:hypothetical protein
MVAKTKFIIIFLALVLLPSLTQRAMADIVKEALRPTGLVSIACFVMNGPGQPTISSSVSRGVPSPTTGNCADDVLGYINQGFKIKSTLSSGTGGIIYILIK